jgi:hypothetical protein
MSADLVRASTISTPKWFPVDIDLDCVFPWLLRKTLVWQLVSQVVEVDMIEEQSDVSTKDLHYHTLSSPTASSIHVPTKTGRVEGVFEFVETQVANCTFPMSTRIGVVSPSRCRTSMNCGTND